MRGKGEEEQARRLKSINNSQLISTENVDQSEEKIQVKCYTIVKSILCLNDWHVYIYFQLLLRSYD